MNGDRDPNAVRIVVADDHAVVRTGIRKLIGSETDMVVVGEAADGRELLDIVKATEPDIAVVDLSMPNIGGIEAIRLLADAAPQTRAIALTMHDDPAYVRLVLAAGGAGFVPKRAVHSEILEAIRTVRSGRTYIEVSLADGSAEIPLPRATAPASKLSEREVEVLTLSAEGYTAQEVAAKLSLSPKTVEGYRARVKDKLGLRSRADLVRYALEVGLLRPSREG